MGKTRKGKLVIARPSFALFEAQCKYSGVDYEPWTLSKNFEYKIDNLPDLPEGSMVIFANPNNPTGSSIPNDLLRELLERNPKVFLLLTRLTMSLQGSLVFHYSRITIIY